MARQLSRLTKLDADKTLFMLCDIQEKFQPGMKLFNALIVNSNKLVQAGKALEVPLIATEHYPEKLGNLVKEIDVSHAAGIFPKTFFSMCIPAVEEKINQIFCGKPKDIVLFGLECHICVEQTAIDLIQNDYNVHIVADCCMSRLMQDRDLALERLRQIGCFVTTSESVIFNLMKDKNHPKFNVVRKLVYEPSADVAINSATKC